MALKNMNFFVECKIMIQISEGIYWQFSNKRRKLKKIAEIYVKGSTK